MADSDEPKLALNTTTGIYTSSRPVKTVFEFAKLICGLDNRRQPLFRGQKMLAEPLLPHIARPKNSFSITAERKSLDEFHRLGVPFLSSPSTLVELEWMAIAQHNGLATRLLDWTDGALTALWFAVESPYTHKEIFSKSREERNRVVWVFMPEETDFVSPQELGKSPFDFRRTKVFKPRNVADRIRAQGGWFTLHHPVQEKRFVPLNKNKRYKENLRCIPIDDNWRSKFMDDLARCGVTSYTVFPDLGGLTSKLNRDMKIEK